MLNANVRLRFGEDYDTMGCHGVDDGIPQPPGRVQARRLSASCIKLEQEFDQWAVNYARRRSLTLKSRRS